MFICKMDIKVVIVVLEHKFWNTQFLEQVLPFSTVGWIDLRREHSQRRPSQSSRQFTSNGISFEIYCQVVGKLCGDMNA